MKEFDLQLRTSRFRILRDPKQIPFADPLQISEQLNTNFRVNSGIKEVLEISVLGAKNMS